MSIPISEQETTISFSRDSDEAVVWTSDSTVITKLDKLVNSNPECWQLIRTGTVGKDVVSKEYKTIKKLVSFRTKVTERAFSDEQRQAMADRMRSARTKSE